MRKAFVVSYSLAVTTAALFGCGGQEAAPAPTAAPVAQAVEQAPAAAPVPAGSEALIARAKALFPAPSELAENPANAVTDAKIALGRQLYFEKRLSKNQDMSCNSCHVLGAYGIDSRTAGAKTSSGHKNALGDRNSPTVYNAALHVAQFWDGRAKDVEEQAKGPILNPVEMAMPNEASVVAVLESIPGYAPLFKAAFPESTSITYQDMANAIGAFERTLITRAPFDAFLAGTSDALDAQQQAGLATFLDAGCTACHMGPALGGQMFQKLGLIKAYPTADEGRFKVTKNEADKFVFKVPSLRNIAKTAPYFHDGSLGTLEEAVKVMVEYQTAKGSFTDEELKNVVAFLGSLTGELPTDYIAEPAELEAGPKTPKPDPS